MKLDETLQKGLHGGLQSFAEILQIKKKIIIKNKNKKKEEEKYERQLQQKVCEKKRQLLALHQREAQIYNQNLQNISDQELRCKREMEAQQLQLQQQEKQMEECLQRLQYHNQEIQRLQQE